MQYYIYTYIYKTRNCVVFGKENIIRNSDVQKATLVVYFAFTLRNFHACLKIEEKR